MPAGLDTPFLLAAAGVALAVAGLMLLVAAIGDLRRRRAAVGRLEQVLTGAVDGRDRGRGEGEAAGGGALESIGERLAKLEKDGGELRRHLVAAGHFNPAHVGAFSLIRLAATVLAGIGGWFGLRALGLPLPYAGPVGAFFAAAVSYLLAKRLLVRKAELRKARIRRELSSVLDVVGMTVESGLTVEQSLRWMAQLEGLGAPETQAVARLLVQDLDSGLPWEDAVRRFAERLAIVEAHDLAAVLIQAVTMGTDVRRPLRAFAAEFTDIRLQAARERIGRISTLLSAIMVAFFLPVLLIVVGAPAFTRLLDGLTRINQ